MLTSSYESAGGNVLKITLNHNLHCYIDKEDLDIIQEVGWNTSFNQNRLRIYTNYEYGGSNINLAKAIYKKHTGVDADFVLNINRNNMDNRFENLVSCTRAEFSAQRISWGCALSAKSFKVTYPDLIGHKSVSTEQLAISLKRELEERSGTYLYHPELDLRDREDLLLKLFNGDVTDEDILVERLKELSKNSWYVYRYNLVGLCKLHNIEPAEPKLDKEGWLIDNDGNRLNPCRRKV